MHAAMVYPRISMRVRLVLKLRSLELSVHSNMYSGHLWHDFRIGRTLRQLIVGYNDSFRFLMKFHLTGSL